jgi:hypothetical protein
MDSSALRPGSPREAQRIAASPPRPRGVAPGAVMGGRCKVILKGKPPWLNYYAYEGHVHVAGRTVTVHGRRTRTTKTGAWTWPAGQVKEIRWISG